MRRNKKTVTKKGRRMGFEGRTIVKIRKERQKGRVIESDRKKRKLLAQNFQKVEILFIGPTNRTPGIPIGVGQLMDTFIRYECFNIE